MSTFKQIFEEFYPPSDESISQLWQEGVFVFDTNVLAGLFRYQIETTLDFFNAIEKLNGRVWIPHHVALEFHKLRGGLKHSAVQRFQRAKSSFELLSAQLDKIVDDTHVTRSYSRINIPHLINDLRNSLSEITKTISSQQETHSQRANEEFSKVESLFNRFFGASVGDPFSSQEEVDKIDKDAETRFKMLHPPGYKDLSKGSENPDDEKQPKFMRGGITFQRKYGDVYIWKQILKHALEAKLRYVCFVTDDQKDDWWDNPKKDTAAPRRELREEIRRISGCEIFHMYKSDQFLQVAATQLKLQIKTESITAMSEAVADLTKIQSPPLTCPPYIRKEVVEIVTERLVSKLGRVMGAAHTGHRSWSEFTHFDGRRTSQSIVIWCTADPRKLKTARKALSDYLERVPNSTLSSSVKMVVFCCPTLEACRLHANDLIERVQLFCDDAEVIVWHPEIAIVAIRKFPSTKNP